MSTFYIMHFIICLFNYSIYTHYEANKGQNSLDEVQRLAYFVKFFTVFLILPLLSTTLMSVKNYVVMTARHDQVYNSLENR